jgi:adenine-specific DNA-methyltransferase
MNSRARALFEPEFPVSFAPVATGNIWTGDIVPTLSFKGKTVIETYHHTVAHHRLEFDEKLSLLPKGQKPSLDGNLIIEGDNLLALKALLPTHAGKIKCIYIDPPYNTGNEGWVYNDNLTQPQFKEWIGKTVGKEGEDATRHDKWCCMMYPRLALLKELLREDGAIFISIGDDEVQHLRSLLDEIFGEENFIASIIWRNSTGPKQSNYLSNSHDYILVYAKTKAKWKRNLLPRTEEQEADYENPDEDKRGPWRSGGLDARNYYSKGTYSITCPGGRVIEGPPKGSYWRYSEEGLWELDADGRIWWGEDGNNVPRVKRFLAEVQDGLIPQTFWDHSEVGHTQEAKQEYLRVLSGLEVFTTPKPFELIQRIVQIATDKDDVILDSYAGSGTTGQAVLQQNAEDGGKRRFVLIQQAFDNKEHEKEKVNIARTITVERVRRVMEGYSYLKRSGKGKTKKATEKGLGGTFSYTHLGDPLFGEYRDLGDKLPPFEEIAKYIFYTETSREADLKKINEKSGLIGETTAAGGTSYYLFYTPNRKADRELSLETLAELLKKDKNRTWVIYCEKIWLHQEQLRQFEQEHKKKVRAMLVPFNLK